MAERVPSLGREVGGQGFPFCNWEQFAPEDTRPRHMRLGFCDPPASYVFTSQTESDVVCKRNHVGLFTFHVSDASDSRPAKHAEQYRPIRHSVRKELFYICAVRYGGHEMHVVLEMQVALEMGLVC